MDRDERLLKIVLKYREELQKKIEARKIEMQKDNTDHYMILGNKAYEIKWKDATTDGDHIKKEHKRVRIIKEAGYIPIRIMFFESNRIQAISIQKRLKKLYEEIGGEYYSGEQAWKYLEQETGINLKSLFEDSKE